MKDFKLDILGELKRLSTPYVDINNICSDYDIQSEYFVASYLQLESEGLIASANTSNCGLKISADGLPFWSVVDVYVTDKGDLALNPPVEKSWYQKPEYLIPLVIFILGCIFNFWNDLQKDQRSNTTTQKQEQKTVPSQPPTNKNSSQEDNPALNKSV